MIWFKFQFFTRSYRDKASRLDSGLYLWSMVMAYISNLHCSKNHVRSMESGPPDNATATFFGAFPLNNLSSDFRNSTLVIAILCGSLIEWVMTEQQVVRSHDMCHNETWKKKRLKNFFLLFRLTLSISFLYFLHSLHFLFPYFLYPSNLPSFSTFFAFDFILIHFASLLFLLPWFDLSI